MEEPTSEASRNSGRPCVHLAAEPLVVALRPALHSRESIVLFTRLHSFNIGSSIHSFICLFGHKPRFSN